MDSQSKVYSRRQLIAVAEVANALAHAKDIAGLEAVPELAEAAFSERLCPDLYPPHQQWQNGGDSSRIGQPASNSKQVWRSLAAKCTERHISDKDDFNYPPAASTYHLLADDVFAFACSGGLGTHASTALKELAVRYKKELASEPPATADPAPAQSPVETASMLDAMEPARDARPDPERRLALLRELGGAAKYARCEWAFKAIKALVDSEKANGRKRSTEKTIRADLKEAAQNERDESRAGFHEGLGQR